MNAPKNPAISPQKPAHGVVRFQNIAMMNVVRDGATLRASVRSGFGGSWVEPHQ